MRISCIVLFVSCLSFSGWAQQSEVRQVGAFQGVRASEGIDVYLKKGDKESVKVDVTGTDLSRVITEVNGTTLKIHMREGNYHGKSSVKVYVTYARIEKLSASSGANIFSTDPIRSGPFEINVSSAGSVEIKLESESVVVNASSAGKTVLEGKTKSLEMEGSSAGDMDAYNLDSETVNVSVSSAGSAKISVSKELEAHASSGGSIRYRGNPLKTNTDSSSGGSVKKTN